MSNILVIKSSILGQSSASNDLLESFLKQLPTADRPLQIVTRDLGENPVPPLDSQGLAALAAEPEARTAEQQERVALSDQLIDELKRADLVLIGAPMYNFSVPAGLKNWIDHVARAGVTFRYTEQGSVGLLGDKQIVVFATMGGEHDPGDTDHLRPYLKTFFNFLGVDTVEFVAASGLNLGQEQRKASLKQARQRLANVAVRVGRQIAQQADAQEAA